jgi:aspartate/methionine/tyrosine aminotransferase
LRIGWIAGPPDVMRQCWGFRDYVSLSPGKLNDALACLGLKHRDAIVARNTRIISENLKSAAQWIAERPYLSWTPPRGGLLALIKYDANVINVPSLELADRLAVEQSVMLAPGSAFGYEHHLRLGIGQRPDIFAEGLRRAGVLLESVVRAGR